MRPGDHSVDLTPSINGVGDGPEQFLDTIASDRVRPSRTGQDARKCRLLADETGGVHGAGSSAARAPLISTSRIVARVTASQMAAPSAISFFCRLTWDMLQPRCDFGPYAWNPFGGKLLN
jgi:hypothetical protein